MKPSEIKLKSSGGYYSQVTVGWEKLEDADIHGKGYKVEFYRLSCRTIDPNCDALNGWHNVWADFCCVYEDEKGKLYINVRKSEDADKIYKIMSDVEASVFEHEDILTAAEVARTKMEAIIRFFS